MVRAGGGWTNDVVANDGLTKGAMVVASGAELAEEMRRLINPDGDD